MIEEGVKLDNQIQIGHNVRIGAHTAIAGCTGISGSTTIGERCMIGGAVGIAGHLTICDDVVITGYSMVSHSITSPGVYSSGIPGGRGAHAGAGIVARFKRLEALAQRVRSWSARGLSAAPEQDGKRMTMTERACSWTSTAILELLPHRYPFLLVDRVLECHAGQEHPRAEERHLQRAVLSPGTSRSGR